MGMDFCGGVMPVKRFEPLTLAGSVFETDAYTVPPHRLALDGDYNTASIVGSQEFFCCFRYLP